MRQLRLILLFLSIILISDIHSQSLRIAVLSDLHFLSPRLIDNGEALSNYEARTGRKVVVLHEVLQKVIDEILVGEFDAIFITGDLTNHGERDSHIDLIQLLTPLKNQGIKIFVVPGNHDVNIPNSVSYIGDTPKLVESITDNQFMSLYNSFGYNNMIMKDRNSLSYLAEIDKSTWLLALDTNLYKEYEKSSISRGRISSETMEWVLDILEEAKSKGITVLGMMHHGLVEHLPYQSTFFSDYLIDDWEMNARILANAGLRVVFTGHFHANDVTSFTTPEGNTVFDVETGSLAQYPFPYRIINLIGNTLDIETHFISEVESEPNLTDRFMKIHERIARSAISNRIKSMGMSLPNETSEVLVELLTRMSVLHAAGDEEISPDTYKIIQRFAKVMDDDNFDPSTFSIDYPPSDNKLKIELR